MLDVCGSLELTFIHTEIEGFNVLVYFIFNFFTISLFSQIFVSAQCEPGCENGICSSPEHCSCVVGWTGDLCERGQSQRCLFQNILSTISF